MRSERNLVGQFGWTTSGNLASALLQFLLYVLLARNLAPERFGIAMSSLGLCLALQAFFELGLGRLIIRERARDPRSLVLARALSLMSYASVAFGASVATILGAASLVWSMDALLLLPLSVAVACEGWATARFGVAIADRRAAVAATDLVQRRVTALVLFLALGTLSMDPLLCFALALAAAGVVSTQTVRMRVPLGTLPRCTLTRAAVIRMAFPYYVNSASVQVRNVDVMAVGLISGAASAGFYSAARRMINPLMLLSNSLASILLPASARAADQESLRLFRGIGLVSLASVLPYGALAWAAPWVVPLALGDAYADAVPLLQVMALGLPVAVHASLVTSFLQGRGDGRAVARISVCCTAVYFVLLYALISVNGVIGAPLAFVLSSVLQVVLQSLYISRSRPLLWRRQLEESNR